MKMVPAKGKILEGCAAFDVTAVSWGLDLLFSAYSNLGVTLRAFLLLSFQLCIPAINLYKMLGSGEAREDNSAQIPHYRVRPLVLAAKQSDRQINTGAPGQGRCNVSRLCYLYCVFQIHPVLKKIKEKNKRNKTNPCVCCSGKHFNIWNSQAAHCLPNRHFPWWANWLQHKVGIWNRFSRLLHSGCTNIMAVTARIISPHRGASLQGLRAPGLLLSVIVPSPAPREVLSPEEHTGQQCSLAPHCPRLWNRQLSPLNASHVHRQDTSLCTVLVDRKKKPSLHLTVHAQWILCLRCLRSMRFCHLRCSSVHKETDMQRAGAQGEEAAMDAYWGAGKGEGVQSRFAHTASLLALLVQSQTRRGKMSQYQAGPEGERHKTRGGVRKAKMQIPPACTPGSWAERRMHPVWCAPRAQAPRAQAPCALSARCGRGEGGEAGALPGESAFRALDPPQPHVPGLALRPRSGECCSVPVQYSTWYGAHPVLCHRRDFPLGTETDPAWKCGVILYIMEDLSFNIFVLNMALLSLLHDLLISKEPALWSINLHGNPYKSGGNALCVCIWTFYSRNFLQT